MPVTSGHGARRSVLALCAVPIVVSVGLVACGPSTADVWAGQVCAVISTWSGAVQPVYNGTATATPPYLVVRNADYELIGAFSAGASPPTTTVVNELKQDVAHLTADADTVEKTQSTPGGSTNSAAATAMRQEIPTVETHLLSTIDAAVPSATNTVAACEGLS